MDTQKVTTEYRLSQWAQLIQKRQDSGQSVNEFCQTTGISRNTYFYRLKRLRKAACDNLEKLTEPKNPVPDGWMQLAPPRQQMESTVDIEINGCHIIADSDTDMELLKKVCQALRSI